MKITSCWCKKKMSTARNEDGFSLFELLTVLVMIGLMAGIAVPSVSKFIAGLEFKKEVGEIKAQLRFVRLKAVVSGEKIKVRVENNALLLLTEDQKKQRLNLGINPDGKLSLSPVEIVFTPQSTVTPSTIYFSAGNRDRKIILDPLTALPVER